MSDFQRLKTIATKKDVRKKVTMAPFLVVFVAVVAWMGLVSPSRASAGPAMSAPQADAQGGDVLFVKRCGGCHSLDQDKEGPRLRHIYGAKAGSTASFKYSSALKSSNVVWNDATLDKWLTNTDSVVPDNDMDYRVPKPEERAAIIQYLKSISSK
jgi:cytochrome c